MRQTIGGAVLWGLKKNKNLRNYEAEEDTDTEEDNEESEDDDVDMPEIVGGDPDNSQELPVEVG